MNGENASPPASVDSGRQVFAIGDIHGCVQELLVGLEWLEAKSGLTDDDVVVCIGDYVDRGPNSKGVVDALLRFRTGHPQTYFLRGNHEEMMLGFLGLGGAGGGLFLANGGEDTLSSYGLPPDPDAVLTGLPPEHREFYQSLERLIVLDEFAFVHAGVDPLRELGAQIDDDLFWIRDTFINNIHHFGLTVVFGHTPFQDVFLHLPYKVGIDTGAVYGNKLSIVELKSMRAAQVKRGGSKVKEKQLKPGKRAAARLK